MPTVLIPLERHTREVEAVKTALEGSRKLYQEMVDAALEGSRKLYQEMVDAAIQWREKYLRLEGQFNALAGQAQRAADLAEGFANQARAADHCVGALRGEVEECRKAHTAMTAEAVENSRKISVLRAELQNKGDVVQSWAKACHELKLEIRRKDKDLSLLRSELERWRKEYTRIQGDGLRTYNEAYQAGRRDGRSEMENAAELANDGCPCTLPIKDIHLDHRKISGEFLNRAIDLHDLLREISEEDPHAVKFKVSNPAMTGSIVALTHALRDFHNSPCQSNEG